jgi:hypothetical protein
MSVLRLATRRSPLALRQAHFVRDRLAASGVDSELVQIETGGDRLADAPLESIGGQGVFAVEMQLALLDGTADVAVHSASTWSACPNGATRPTCSSDDHSRVSDPGPPSPPARLGDGPYCSSEGRTCAS